MKKILIILLLGFLVTSCNHEANETLPAIEIPTIDVVPDLGSTPKEYTEDIGFLYDGAEVSVSTIHRSGKLLYKANISNFPNLRDNNSNRTFELAFEDVNSFKVTSTVVQVSDLVKNALGEGIYGYDGEIYLSEEDYKLIEGFNFITNIKPELKKGEYNKMVGYNSEENIKGTEIIKKYYNSISEGNFKQAYDLSVQKSPYDTFYGWFKDTEYIDIHGIIAEDNNWYSINVTVHEKSGEKTNYKTKSKVGYDSSGNYRILETKIQTK